MSLALLPLNLHGFTIDEGLARFVGEYNRVLTGGRYDGLEVIHGKGRDGAGGLRPALRDYLSKHGTRIRGFDAQLLVRGAEYLLDTHASLVYAHGEEATNNGGCTIVIPRRRLPAR